MLTVGLPAVLADYRRRYPGIDIVVHEGGSRDLQDALIQGGVLWALTFSFGAYQLGSAATGIGSILTYVGLALTVVLTVVITLLTRRSFAQLESRVAEEDKQMAVVR